MNDVNATIGVNTKTGVRLFMAVVVFLMFLALLSLTLAVSLSLFADTTLAVPMVDGSTVEQRNYVGASIEKLWQGFFSAVSAIIGLLGGKVL